MVEVVVNLMDVVEEVDMGGGGGHSVLQKIINCINFYKSTQDFTIEKWYKLEFNCGWS